MPALREFETNFKDLMGNMPFPWQRALFENFMAQQFPKICNIPTGLGKTSTIAIWLLARAYHGSSASAARDIFPRRLVYVVNRRTVVDQATREVEIMGKALREKSELKSIADSLHSLSSQRYDSPLAISTLRGQHADNAEWRNDPSRPAIIIGTVDMIGSRLLFSGYGCGFKSRPLHAAFLGQDILLVHDEAHLEPAFQELLVSLESQQMGANIRSFHLMAMSATSRSDYEPFGISNADYQSSILLKRLKAKKTITFQTVMEERDLADSIFKHALKCKDSGSAILIFLRRLEDVERVTEKLRKAKLCFQKLTGTLRGFERDKLVREDPIFARFMPRPAATPQDGTVYLVATAAGEVGIDISADHMICDLTPFDSMAQRFGRVNRFGNGDAKIVVVHQRLDEEEKAVGINPTTEDDATDSKPGSDDDRDSRMESKKKTRSQNAFEDACDKTLALLQSLPRCEDQCYDASPAALAELSAIDRMAAFTPAPEIHFTTEILLDSWALTSIRERMPGRPPVTEWLHGVSEWQPPETYVAWREEVDCINGGLLSIYAPEDLLEDYPLKPHELLRDATHRVSAHLEKIAERCPEAPVWVIEADARVGTFSMKELVAKNRQKEWHVDLRGRTVLLSPKAAGLERGTLEGGAEFDESERYDISDEWLDDNESLRRIRVWDSDAQPPRMRLVRSIDFHADMDESEDSEQGFHRYWNWYVQSRSADDDGSQIASLPQELVEHLRLTENYALEIIDRLGLGINEKTAILFAARWHDRGKNRKIWQRSIGNNDYPVKVLAKSGGKMLSAELSKYRHELGSAIEVSSDAEFLRLSLDVRDLTLHLILAHHGRARPHFPEDEAFDPEHAEENALTITRETPRRFARLERKYGRWGLAYLESLVRAADALASQSIKGPFTGSNELTQELEQGAIT